MKNFTIQNTELNSRPYSVAWYNDAKILIAIINKHMASETELEMNEVLKYAADFEKLTEGITIEEFSKDFKDKKQLEKLNKIITKNIKKFPGSIKAVSALNAYNDKIIACKESFLTGNSIIKNEYGIDTMISNLRLLITTHTEGNIEDINFNTNDLNEIFELIDIGKDVLEDFFLVSISLKDRLKISSLTLRAFSSLSQT